MPTSADFIEGSNVSIGHLGIVAGAFDTLGIAGVVDRAIPKTRHHHLTHGDTVKAMVLNGLGFVERRLYLYPEFFSDIAVDRLLGDGVTIDHLNDDVLGRTLDAIAAYGPTELFNEIVAECLLASDYGTHCLHVDTTAFSVSGEYDADTDCQRRRNFVHFRRSKSVHLLTLNDVLEGRSYVHCGGISHDPRLASSRAEHQPDLFSLIIN